MKYIKINTTVNLTSGIEVPSGSAVVITEGYADVKNQKDGLMPAQVAVSLYPTIQAMLDGKQPVQGIADFTSPFQYLKLPVTDYETVSAETLLIGAVYQDLALVYGEDNIEVVTVA
jgi:PKD repeat protein